MLYLVFDHEQQIEGNSGHHVYDEPAFEVVKSDLAGMRHHLVLLVNVGGPEVYHDVYDEHYVH